MKHRLSVAFLVALGMGGVAGPVMAHHGSASFDSNKRLTMKGTVTEWFWANPHCFLKFDVLDEKGNPAHWIAETSNPSDMSNLGWSKQTFKVGDQITVTLQPVKNGQPIGRVMQVVLPNGQTMSTGARPSGSPGPSSDATEPADSPKY